MKKAIILAGVLLPLAASHGASLLYRNAVLANNPIAYYEFDEASGTVAADATTANNGTFTGTGIGYGAASGAPNLGTAIDFTGGYVVIPTLGTHAQSSVEAWINYDVSVPGCCSSIMSSNDWATGALHFNVNGNQFEHAVNGDSPVSVNTPVSPGTWYHMVVTNDVGAGETKYYLNGVEVSDTGDHSLQNVVIGNSGLQIGAWNGTRLFDGRMDEFAIYDSVLSASDVAAHFAAASATAVPEPARALLLLVGTAFACARRRR